MQTLSHAGLDMLKFYEGYENVAYKDSGGVWTLGYGTTHGICSGMSCTPALAEQWLIRDVASSENAVRTLVKMPMDQGMFDALVDFTYNLGSGALAKSTLLKLLNQEKYDDAAKEFPKWNLCAGKPLAGLTKRRNAERDMFLSGMDSGEFP